MKNECLDAVTSVLEEADIPYTVGMGGKHYRIDFEVNGRRCRATAPVTSSDVRAPRNSASQTRRILREAGYVFSDQQEASMSSDSKGSLSYIFEGKQVRVVDREGATWLVANDVCAALDIADARQALGKLDDDERGGCLVPTPSGHQEMRVVNESGLYTLILRCRGATTPGTLPHRFRRWVTGEVLPALRKHGAYSTDPAVMALLTRMEGMTKMLSHKAAVSEKALATALREISEVRAAADLAMEASAKTEARLSEARVAPTLDLIGTMTSDELIGRAGIKGDQRVRGTSAMVTARLLRFTAGHGCFRTPAALNPSMPWRFSRDRALEWLFGPSLGVEQIRSQVERETNKRRVHRQPTRQGNLTLVVPA